MKYIKTIMAVVVMLTVAVVLLPLLLIVYAFSFWRMRQLSKQFQTALRQHYTQFSGDTFQADTFQGDSSKGDSIEGEYQVIRD